MSTYVLEQKESLRALLLSRMLGIISVAGMAITTIPPSSIVGAMLWTGYVGNIVVGHLNMIQA
jgi:hypothetical protein